jgi:hypothetical protein
MSTAMAPSNETRGVLRPLGATGLFLALALLFAASPGRASPEAADATRQHLYAGTFTAGVGSLEQRVAADPGDREARFGLGMLQFMRAVEHLGQGFYRHGLQPPHSVSVPLLRLPVPVNPNPEPITYENFRAILQTFADDLAVAEATLARVGDNDVALVVDLMQVRLDMRADGHPGDDETLARIMAALAGVPTQRPPPVPALEVKFDAGDAAWLGGYAHALMALDEFLLAHDFHVTFDATFHHFFAHAVTPFAVPLAAPAPPGAGFGFPDSTIFGDIVAFIHTINWPVVEPARMGRVRTHLLAMVEMSRRSWKLIEAETGDDREWIPNPRQKNAALGASVSERQLAAWYQVLDEADAMLNGRTLVPHWRFEKGIDLKKFFEEPQTFDLVMLLTGSGAVPFLVEGPVTSGERWHEITRDFEGSFFSYAIWFN